MWRRTFGIKWIIYQLIFIANARGWWNFFFKSHNAFVMIVMIAKWKRLTKFSGIWGVYVLLFLMAHVMNQNKQKQQQRTSWKVVKMYTYFVSNKREIFHVWIINIIEYSHSIACQPTYHENGDERRHKKWDEMTKPRMESFVSNVFVYTVTTAFELKRKRLGKYPKCSNGDSKAKPLNCLRVA